MSVSFGRIVQHGYVVEDVERTARAWARRLGVGPFYVVDQRIENYRYLGRIMAIDLRIAVSYWGGIQLELIQQLSPQETFYSAALADAPEKLNHQAVLVSDVDATVRRLGLQEHVVHTGSLPSVEFAYLGNYLPDGLALELLAVAPVALHVFGGMEAIANQWDGERVIRTHAELAADLAAT